MLKKYLFLEQNFFVFQDRKLKLSASVAYDLEKYWLFGSSKSQKSMGYM